MEGEREVGELVMEQIMQVEEEGVGAMQEGLGLEVEEEGVGAMQVGYQTGLPTQFFTTCVACERPPRMGETMREMLDCCD